MTHKSNRKSKLGVFDNYDPFGYGGNNSSKKAAGKSKSSDEFAPGMPDVMGDMFKLTGMALGTVGTVAVTGMTLNALQNLNPQN